MCVCVCVCVHMCAHASMLACMHMGIHVWPAWAGLEENTMQIKISSMIQLQCINKMLVIVDILLNVV